MTGSLAYTPLSSDCLAAVTGFFQSHTGIVLGPAKRDLIEGRLRRLLGSKVTSLEPAVWSLLDSSDPAVQARVVDALVTNETFFFREPVHFDWLDTWAKGRQAARLPMRVWSAACSSGEEAYSAAMVLARRVGENGGWSVTASDVSETMLRRGRRGLYPQAQTALIPADCRQRWCLRGEGRYAGTVLMAGALRERVSFRRHNLLHDRQPKSTHDLIFLRNVLIYFDRATKLRLLTQVLEALAPHGVLITGHAESLTGLGLPLQSIAPAVLVRTLEHGS